MFSPLSWKSVSAANKTCQQNEYAQILAKRVAEAKSLKADLRKRRASSMRK